MSNNGLPLAIDSHCKRGTDPLSEVNDQQFLHGLRRLGHIEGTSTLVLFGIAMPLKYFAGMPMAVRIVGSIHGVLFVALAVMCVLAIRRVPISRKLATAGVLGAVIPFGPFVVDRTLKKLVGNSEGEQR